MAMVELENQTGNVQSVYTDEGIQHVLMPYAARNFPEAVANQFLRERTSFVRRALGTAVPILLPGEVSMWIANMTGNPFVEPVFKSKVIKREHTAAGVVSQEVEEMTPNPVATPATLRWRLQTGQGKDPYGRIKGINIGDDFNLPPITITLKPRTRVVVSENIGQWMIQRDAMEGAMGAGKVAECREPTSFEPTMMWPIDQVIFYARMLDQQGFDKSAIDSIFATCNPDKSKILKLENIVADEALDERVKDALLARLFFRLVDKRFNPPSQKAFEAAYDNFKRAVTDIKKGKDSGARV